MANCIIQNNIANVGAGVYNNNVFNMNGGTISGNNAKDNGGGVYNNNVFNMNGGTNFGNNAKVTMVEGFTTITSSV